VRGCNPDFLLSPLRSRDRLRPVRRWHMLPYPVPATRRRSADMAGAPPFAGGRSDTRGLKAQLGPPHGRDHAGVPACRLGNLAAKA